MDRKEINKLIKRRDGLIDYINKNLEQKIKSGQKEMFDLFVSGLVDKMQRDENGKILNNNFNRLLILQVDKTFTEYGKKSGVEVLSAMVTGVNAVLDFNNDYYGKFAPAAELLPLKKNVIEQTRGWLGIDGNQTTENGYLSTLINAETVRNGIKDFALKAVTSQIGWAEAKRNLSTMIQGDREKLGALEKYHRNFAYDLFSQVDRATAKTYADKLKFDFAIYEGGLIETSREFCKEHNGNVYHKTEVEKFNPKVAKQPNYNPFTDLGGYGCRHTLNWIPTSLALMMRPDAAKFTDGKQAAEPEPKESEKARKRETDKLDSSDINYKGYDDLIKKAAGSGQELDNILTGIKKKYGGYSTPINYKSRESIYRKVTTELDGNISEVKDAVRTTVILGKKERDSILDELKKNPIFEKVKDQTPDKFAGYSGILTNVKLKSGILGEVQFNTEKMIYAKEKPADAKRIIGEQRWNEIKNETGLEGGLGHEFYEKIRVLKDGDKNKIELEKQSHEYYKHFRND